MPRVVNNRHLESEADTKVGHAILPRKLGGKHFAMDAAVAETAWHEDAGNGPELFPGLCVAVGLLLLLLGLEIRGLDPVEVKLALAGV